jgi:integrase
VTTGLRQGELLALKWTDVDWLARRIRVADNFPRGRSDEADTPKSHHLRSVPMADGLAGELERHFQRSAFRADHDLVFCHPVTGGAYDASALRKRFYEALERAGLRRITFHELRHTFGTQMAAAGAPLRAIQEWLGHANAKTTEATRTTPPMRRTEPPSSTGRSRWEALKQLSQPACCSLASAYRFRIPPRRTARWPTF